MGAAWEMQRLYPEGFVFMTALYGLSWAELAGVLPPNDSLGLSARHELKWALSELTSEDAQRTFNKNLDPAYGIFYRGWSNYVLGRTLEVTPGNERDPDLVQDFRENCAEIFQALENRESPYLESYYQACWPADMVIAMASVAIAVRLFPGEFEAPIQGWLEKVKKKTDELGLIPHAASWDSGESLEPARGSSQGLILNFLWEIDPDFAKQQFEIYRENFLTYRLGLPGIREYPKGKKGKGDVDSGPVIWDIGGAASIVGQRVMDLYGEPDEAIGLRNSIETFACGMTIRGEKKYLFGVLPLADAFIAWSNSVEVLEQNRLAAQGWWWVKMQGFILFNLFFLGLAIFVLLKKVK
ncbi:MAG: hypothetical protein H6563_09760 [Lewinellaceae bacterium]|nr:hypothetical protein [Lewinellaceae bacterium]